MTTKVKSSRTSRKSANNRVNSAAINVAGVNVAAPAGAGVTAGGAAAGSVLPAGATSYNKVRISSDVQLENAIERESIDVKSLKSSICARWAAPEWSGAAAVRAALSGVPGMTEEMINGAVAAAARKSGVDLTPPSFTLDEVLDVIHTTFASDWARVVGCDASELTAESARVYDYNGVVLGAVNTAGTINQLVTDLLSFRFLVAVRRAAAWAAGVAHAEAVRAGWSAGAACFSAGMSLDDALSLVVGRVRAYYENEHEREMKREIEKHNARVDLNVLNTLLCDALALGRAALAEKLRNARKKVLKRLEGRALDLSAC